MQRRPTPSELTFSIPPDFADLWNHDLAAQILRLTWEGLDALYQQHQSGHTPIDWSRELEQIERDLTQSLELKIRARMTGLETFIVQHERSEMESRKDAKSKPPAMDIAFVLRQDERIAWPLETKVLRTDKTVSQYINEGVDRFLDCTYSPFSTGGAMLGYLRSGDPETAIQNIAAKLGTSLTPYAEFADRCHKTSQHARTVPSGKTYPVDFCLHHLIFPLQAG